MPEISKINALAIGSVGKVDGLAKASILDIDGVAVPAAVAPPLDTYTGAAAAYSVRLLRTAYTGDIMRVRRDSDNVEADVGFDGSNKLSLTSPISNTSDAQSYTDFADFVDHTGTPTDAFVRYWYDQASTNDVGQPTAGSQPKIYDATTGFIQEGSTGNEKPAIDIINYGLHATGLSYSITNASVFAVAKKDSVLVSYLSTLWRLGDGATRQNEFTIWHDKTNRDTINIRREESSTVTNASATGVTEVLSQHIMTGMQTSTQMLAYVNGTNKITQSLTPSAISLTSIDIGAEFINQLGVQYEGRIQEVVIYHSDQSSNRAGIETNLNDFFNIY